MSSRPSPLLLVVLTAMVLGCIAPVPSLAADEEECLRCHGLRGLARRDGESVKALAIDSELFESSVHTLLNCRECHSDISAIPHPEASSEVSCGQPCHQRTQSGEIYSHEALFWEYTGSVHGKAKDRTIGCTLCHPARSLSGLISRDLRQEADQCSSCHAGSTHVRGFFDTFHYLALSRGDRRAPSCPDCHSSHRILPPTDPESTVHPSRLAGTCGAGALTDAPSGRCHGDLPEAAVERATMHSLPLPGGKSSPLGLFFSVLYWTMLAALLARVLIGAGRGR